MVSKEKVVERKELGQDGKKEVKMRTPLLYECTNLAFLVDFLNATRTSVAAITETRSEETALRAMLRNDNMMLSRARAIIAKAGFKLNVRYVFPEENQNNTIIIIEGASPTDKNPNIRFLLEALEKKKMTFKKLSEDININQGTIWCWVKVDDIRISYLPLIAEKLNLKLEYKITRDSD